MLTRLDTLVIAAWLLTGGILVENNHRIDRTVPDGAPAPATETCRPVQPSPRGSLSLMTSVALAGEGGAAYVHVLAEQCEGRP